MRISDWSSDVCSSDLRSTPRPRDGEKLKVSVQIATRNRLKPLCRAISSVLSQDYPEFEILVLDDASDSANVCEAVRAAFSDPRIRCFRNEEWSGIAAARSRMMELGDGDIYCSIDDRSEEHTSELQSLMRTSYAVFCLKKKIHDP